MLHEGAVNYEIYDATKWEISSRRVQVLCAEGRLNGAVKFGRQWAIPVETTKPEDARIKSGKYIKGEADENDKA